MILFLIKILLSFLRLFVVAIERVDRDITGGSVAGSSVFDPVKKKTRAGGGRSQPGEDRSTTGPIGRGTEALVLRDVLLQTAGGSSGVLLRTAGGSRDLSTVKDR